MHYRSSLKEATALVAEVKPSGVDAACFQADVTQQPEAEQLIENVYKHFGRLDVLINNAGVYTASDPVTPEGLDVRFAVNTIAPYLLTQRLLPLMGNSGRVLNLSSAAQSPVNIKALTGQSPLPPGAAYAQSKLALNMWSHHMALSLPEKGPVIIAINPGSLLGSKMVREAFGMEGGDLRIGADILCRAALSDEFADASGQYFDNDQGQFASPHHDALDRQKCEEIVQAIESVVLGGTSSKKRPS